MAQRPEEMKRALVILALGLSLFTTGCGIFPKRVEFFQDKVRPYPVQKSSERETQRQAAQRAAEKAAQTLDAALTEGSTPAVIEPAKETEKLTDAVSRSLGPPISPATVPSDELSRKLDRAIARFQQRLDEFKSENDSNAGKKIEGSGLFSVPYFLWIGILGAVLFIVYFGLKTVVHIAAAGNPAVALGLNAVQLGGRGVAAVAKEVIQGGKIFREKLAAEMPEVQARVEKLFKDSQRQAQSPATQEAIDKLLK